MAKRFDIVIVGGGIVGAALALMLARQRVVAASRIALIERERPPAPVMDAPWDLRVSAISPLHRSILESLGVWQRMDAARIVSYEKMVVWHEATPPDSPDVLRFDAAELGEPHLGCIVENRALQVALLAACESEGVQLLPAMLQSLAMDVNGVNVTLEDDVLEAELVAGADGAASRVRECLGLNWNDRSYGQQAIVATVRVEKGHANTAWQRFLSTGPVALLPLPGDQCSIVWSLVDARVSELMAASPEDFSKALTDATAGVRGQLTLVSERRVFPLRRATAAQYVAGRCVLVGDAAHVIHPLAGQGVNQGLQDAIALVTALTGRPRGESVGASAALRRYERERRIGNSVMAAMVNGLDAAFTGSGGVRAWLAREAMAQVSRHSLAREFFFTRAAAGRSLPRR